MSECDDPVIQILTQLQFDSHVFADFQKSKTDQETYQKLFASPNLLALLHMMEIIEMKDPDAGNVQMHSARLNFIKWFIVAYLAYPSFRSFLGWFFTYPLTQSKPDSYWPVRFGHEFFLENWRKTGETNEQYADRYFQNIIPDVFSE